jgi:hypothetical protein
MAQLDPGADPKYITGPHKNTNLENITVSAKILNALAVGIPAVVTAHDRNSVAITGKNLSEMLQAYYDAGVQRVEVVIDVAGQKVAATCRIYQKTSKQAGRATYWLYPLYPAQALLREMLRRHRGEAPRKAKRPLPITVVAVVPKPK